MMAKSKNLYDLPFEQRIRIKYFLFGASLALSGIGVMGLIGLTTSYIMSIVLDIEFVTRGDDRVMFATFSLFAPLAYYMWYSKAKPIKHPFLNETVGLKEDYEKVKGL